MKLIDGWIIIQREIYSEEKKKISFEINEYELRC